MVWVGISPGWFTVERGSRGGGPSSDHPLPWVGHSVATVLSIADMSHQTFVIMEGRALAGFCKKTVSGV